jgi:hypothetical protein
MKNELLDLAERYEPVMQGRFERAAAKLRGEVSLDRLTLALADKDHAKVRRVALSEARLRDAMKPIDELLRETLIPRGGRAGARALNK